MQLSQPSVGEDRSWRFTGEDQHKLTLLPRSLHTQLPMRVWPLLRARSPVSQSCWGTLGTVLSRKPHVFKLFIWKIKKADRSFQPLGSLPKGQDQAKSQNSILASNSGGRDSRTWVSTHCLPTVHAAGKLALGVRLDPSYSNMGCRCPKHHFNYDIIKHWPTIMLSLISLS